MARYTQEPREAHVSIRVKEAEHERVKREAEALGITVSEWVRRLILGKIAVPKEATIGWPGYGSGQGES